MKDESEMERRAGLWSAIDKLAQETYALGHTVEELLERAEKAEAESARLKREPRHGWALELLDSFARKVSQRLYGDEDSARICIGDTEAVLDELLADHARLAKELEAKHAERSRVQRDLEVAAGSCEEQERYIDRLKAENAKLTADLATARLALSTWVRDCEKASDGKLRKNVEEIVKRCEGWSDPEKMGTSTFLRGSAHAFGDCARLLRDALRETREDADGDGELREAIDQLAEHDATIEYRETGWVRVTSQGNCFLVQAHEESPTGGELLRDGIVLAAEHMRKIEKGQ